MLECISNDTSHYPVVVCLQDFLNVREFPHDQFIPFVKAVVHSSYDVHMHKVFLRFDST